MEILKQGDLKGIKKTKRFTCGRCGCVFNADITEYQMASYIESAHDNIAAKCVCPCCHETAYSYFDSNYR